MQGELSEIERALLLELGGELPPEAPAPAPKPKNKTKPAKSTPKKATAPPAKGRKRPAKATKKAPARPAPAAAPAPLLDVTTFGPIDPDANVTEHIIAGTNEALIVARHIVRGEIHADPRTRMAAAKLVTDLGVKQIELEQRRERDAAKKVLTLEQARALRRKTLVTLLGKAG